jgi:hypothetical protein
VEGIVFRKPTTVTVLVLVVASAVMTVSAQSSRAKAPAAPAKDVRVFKQVGCGCCELWAQHMRKAGFTVTVSEAPDLERIKREQSVPASMGSCHTSLVGGYVIEGHVPADVVQQLLTERPKVKGIVVPGMPIGSPGMEQGSTKQRYSVFTVDAAGQTSLYATR